MDPGVKLAAVLSAVVTLACLFLLFWSDPGAATVAPLRVSSSSADRSERVATRDLESPGEPGLSETSSQEVRAITGSELPRPDSPPPLAREYPRLASDAPPVGPSRLADRRRGWMSEPVGLRAHRVRDGDTLPRLAQRYLGSAQRYLEIYELNRRALPGPDELPIGVTLRIPPMTPAPETATVEFRPGQREAATPGRADAE